MAATEEELDLWGPPKPGAVIINAPPKPVSGVRIERVHGEKSPYFRPVHPPAGWLPEASDTDDAANDLTDAIPGDPVDYQAVMDDLDLPTATSAAEVERLQKIIGNQTLMDAVMDEVGLPTPEQYEELVAGTREHWGLAADDSAASRLNREAGEKTSEEDMSEEAREQKRIELEALMDNLDLLTPDRYDDVMAEVHELWSLSWDDLYKTLKDKFYDMTLPRSIKDKGDDALLRNGVPLHSMPLTLLTADGQSISVYCESFFKYWNEDTDPAAHAITLRSADAHGRKYIGNYLTLAPMGPNGEIEPIRYHLDDAGSSVAIPRDATDSSYISDVVEGERHLLTSAREGGRFAPFADKLRRDELLTEEDHATIAALAGDSYSDAFPGEALLDIRIIDLNAPEVSSDNEFEDEEDEDDEVPRGPTYLDELYGLHFSGVNEYGIKAKFFITADYAPDGTLRESVSRMFLPPRVVHYWKHEAGFDPNAFARGRNAALHIMENVDFGPNRADGVVIADIKSQQEYAEEKARVWQIHKYGEAYKRTDAGEQYKELVNRGPIPTPLSKLYRDRIEQVAAAADRGVDIDSMARVLDTLSRTARMLQARAKVTKRTQEMVVRMDNRPIRITAASPEADARTLVSPIAPEITAPDSLVFFSDVGWDPSGTGSRRDWKVDDTMAFNLAETETFIATRLASDAMMDTANGAPLERLQKLLLGKSLPKRVDPNAPRYILQGDRLVRVGGMKTEAGDTSTAVAQEPLSGFRKLLSRFKPKNRRK